MLESNGCIYFFVNDTYEKYAKAVPIDQNFNNHSVIFVLGVYIYQAIEPINKYMAYIKNIIPRTLLFMF